MLNTLWITTRWAIVPTALSIILTSTLLSDFYWDSELFHVIIEGGGALIGFGLAFIVLAMIQKGQLGANYLWLIACFISMGTLDIVHSQQHPGQAFVWLHTAATVIGGFFAMLIWLPAAFSARFFHMRYFWGLLLSTIALSAASVLWPDATPLMLDIDKQFTWQAKFLNMLGGMAFLTAWLYFAREYHYYHHPQSFYFSNHFCLFALAGFVFEFSALWDGNWWFWHMMRAFAYILLMFHFGMIYRRKLENSNLLLEQSLQASRIRYRTLIESSPDWVWEVSREGAYAYCSPKSYDILGYTPGELLGRTPFELMPADEAARARQIFNDLSASKSPVQNLEVTHLHKNGDPVVLEINGVPIIDEAGELLGYHGLNHDVSARKENEHAIRAQQHFTNTILEAAANIIVVLDLDGHIVHFNRAAENLTGYGSDEVLGKIIWELVIPEEQLPGVQQVFENLRNGDIEIASQYENEWLTRNHGRRLLRWHNSVLHNDDGNITHIVALGYDITEQKEAEKEHLRMQNELRQAQKMESLGQLTGGIAHDFNNLLGIINGYASLTLNKYRHQCEDKLVEYIHNIEEAATRATNLIEQMLSFSRGDQADDRPIQFGPLIKEDIKMLRATLPSTIEIDSEVEEGLPDVLMNPTQLHQILMNLSVNARDAMNGVGKLIIQLRLARDLDTVSSILHKPVTGDWVDLTVSDTGTGLDPGMISNIFDPFFTTKEVGKGSGMGLSVIYRIMENHGGHILVESVPGNGASFRMLFPPGDASQQPSSAAETDEAHIPEGDGSEILVVDDEPLLANHLSDLFTLHGYRAHAVTDGLEALEVFRADPGRFSALVTDQTMPGLTGLELIAEVRSVRPGLPLVLCTGYSDKIDANSAQELNIPYLKKPVNANRLLGMMSELLGQS